MHLIPDAEPPASGDVEGSQDLELKPAKMRKGIYEIPFTGVPIFEGFVMKFKSDRADHADISVS